jgi:DNA topoisomerase-1
MKLVQIIKIEKKVKHIYSQYLIMSSLVIVESPAKCKKIESYLGNGYKCIASFGHIYRLSDVDNSNNYKPEFKTLPEKGKYIKNLRASIKKAKEVILATDDDREGEAIAWHICRLAKLPINTTKRIIFHEITKAALQKAIRNPTTINMEKVNAQLGRQVLDRMVGFTISPTLWKQFFHGGKNKTSLSAGRCQTPALRLVYENQKEIDESPGNKVWETTGIFTKRQLVFKLNYEYTVEDEMEDFMEESANFDHKLLKPNKPTTSTRKAPLPFSTSTLQQKASNELHYSPKRTMQLAQKLYENGYITYMRTDNKKYSKEFIKQIIPFIKNKWEVDNDYINSNIGKFTIGKGEKKDKNAQEAHEAIRPTKLNVEHVNIGDQENRLYRLIWTNTVESCMADAKLNIIKAIVTAPMEHKYEYKAEMVTFPGWLIVNGYDKVCELYHFIKNIKQKSVEYQKIYAKQNLKNLRNHFTEARLVQLLEKKGIGRPSTFSSLISKIQEREYVKKGNVEGKKISCTDYQLKDDELDEIDIKRTFGNERNKLIIQPLGIMVIEFLLKQFDPLFVYEYTENMERKLDNISNGESKWQDLCRECDTTMKSLTKEIKEKKAHIKIDEHHVYMVGKYGPVIKMEKNGETKFINVKENLDLDKLKRGEYNIDDIKVEKPNFGGKNLGKYKNNDVMLKKGKFGLYLTCNGKNFSIKGIKKSEEEITLSDVEGILSGKKSSNPNVLKILNENLSIRKGKYGPYLFYKKKTMSKPKFYSLQQLFKVSKNEKIPDSSWKGKSETYLINLFKSNCS